MSYFVVGAGGLFGAIFRYQVGRWFESAGRAGALFLPGLPLATLCVNVSGSFLIGVVFGLFSASSDGLPPDPVRLLFVTGFLGAFTTFSAFSIETLQLLQQGNVWIASCNVMLNVSLCLLAVFVGFSVGGQIQSWFGA